MKWVQLKIENQWGAEHLYHPKDKKEKRPILFPKGKEIDIRWPDGTKELVEIQHKIEDFEVGDMGHSFRGTHTLHGFETNIHGVVRWIGLHEVEVADDFPGLIKND